MVSSEAYTKGLLYSAATAMVHGAMWVVIIAAEQDNGTPTPSRAVVVMVVEVVSGGNTSAAAAAAATSSISSSSAVVVMAEYPRRAKRGHGGDASRFMQPKASRLYPPRTMVNPAAGKGKVCLVTTGPS